MNRWIIPVAAFALLGVAGAVRADVPGPKDVPNKVKLGSSEVKLEVIVDDKTEVARLILPQALLTEGGKKRADAGWPMPTIMAGLALTAAFISAGLWLVRRGAVRTGAAAVLFVSLLALGVSALQANPVVREPKAEPKPGVVTLPAQIKLSGKLILEVVEKGDTVKLVVNSSMILKKGEKK